MKHSLIDLCLCRPLDLQVPNKPPCTIPGIFLGYDFLKAHPKSCKIRHVSTLAVGAFTRGGPLSTLPIRLFMEFYRFVVILTASLVLAWFMIVSSESFLGSKLMSLSRVIFVRMVNCNVENKYNLV